MVEHYNAQGDSRSRGTKAQITISPSVWWQGQQQDKRLFSGMRDGAKSLAWHFTLTLPGDAESTKLDRRISSPSKFDYSEGASHQKRRPHWPNNKTKLHKFQMLPLLQGLSDKRNACIVCLAPLQAEQLQLF